MSLIEISGLSFAYGDNQLFDRVDLRLDTQWRLGLIGRNGRGKTTLLHLLAGELPYGGSIRAGVDFMYFPYTLPNANAPVQAFVEDTGCMEWEMQREFSLLDLPPDIAQRQFSTLSGGEQTKVLLAAMFLKEHGFPLIDEPTNHLDTAARRRVAAYLRQKSGFVLVSHDRELLDGCTDHILSLNKTGPELMVGNYSDWETQKQRRDQAEVAQNQRLKKEITRLDAAAKQATAWSEETEKTKIGTRIAGLRPDRGRIGHKAAKMMKHAKNVERRRTDAAQEKSELLHDVEENQSLKLHPLTFHAQQLVELKGVTLYYGEKAACKEVSFEIKRGERVALLGYNGSGKSSILKLIHGQPIKYSGQWVQNSALKVSYVPQSTQGLSGSLSAYASLQGVDGSLLRTILRKMDFSRRLFEADIATYSEGQKKKVLLAGSLCQSAHLYVWDEPLNYIDLFSRVQLEELLLEYAPSLLFVEHDGRFCQRIATKTVQLL